jgi:hypothetical protein
MQEMVVTWGFREMIARTNAVVDSHSTYKGTITIWLNYHCFSDAVPYQELSADV